MDFITYLAILVFIIILSWLSNKEIKKSLKKSRGLENELRRENYLLEMRVEERTKELKESQLNRINELAKVAEFGRLSQGLFHDLMSPLTPLFLHMETIKDLSPEKINESKASLEKIIISSQRMSTHIKKLRSNINQESLMQKCSVIDEIKNVIELFSFKANTNNVTIITYFLCQCYWFGDKVKLQQIFSNLISNAIDACCEINNRDRNVIITLKERVRKVIFSIKDNGGGIERINLEKIFDPFYTTKSAEQGTGIGLTTVKRILGEIQGEITVKSRVDIGTEFIVEIPIT